MIPLLRFKTNTQKTNFSSPKPQITTSVRFIQKFVKVILTTDYKGLGVTGQEVIVKRGFGKNYLVPTNKAVLYTPDERESIPQPTSERLLQVEKDKMLENAAKKFATIKVEIKRKGKKEPLAYPVTPEVIVEKLWRQHFVEIQPSQVQLDKEISSYGPHVITVKIADNLIPLTIVVKSI